MTRRYRVVAHDWRVVCSHPKGDSFVSGKGDATRAYTRRKAATAGFRLKEKE